MFNQQRKEMNMYNEGCNTAPALSGLMQDQTPSPLAIAKGRLEVLDKQTQEIKELIALLENNPDIEKLLKLSRRYI